MDSAMVRTRLRSYLEGNFGDRDFDDEDDIVALGFGNSLFALQMVDFIEREFEIEIEGDDLNPQSFESVSSIVRFVAGKTSG